MSPSFARAVDPVFLYVLELIERIEQNRPVNVEEARHQIQKRIDHAAMTLGATPEWELAKYALVCWIDSMLIHAPWPGNNWWENNPLERTYFFGRNAYTQFFAKAREAAALMNKDSLEVYYLCVVLGFRGFYDSPTAAQFAAQVGLPGRVEEWAQQTGSLIQIGLGRPNLDAAPQVGDGAPPLDARLQLMAMSVFGIVALAATIGVFITWFFAGPTP